MQTATPIVFFRVTKRRPCLICGKPDWRLYVRDESLSVCRRVSDGARKINRHGGAIHIPGFWKDARGFHLWKEADYHSPRLLIPVRDDLGILTDTSSMAQLIYI